FGVCGFVSEEALDPYGQCVSCADDSLGCLSAGLGNACFPACDEPCPSPRSGTRPPICLEVDGKNGCAIPCDRQGTCPDGMACTKVGIGSLCLWPKDNPCDSTVCAADRVCEISDGE